MLHLITRNNQKTIFGKTVTEEGIAIVAVIAENLVRNDRLCARQSDEI